MAGSRDRVRIRAASNSDVSCFAHDEKQRGPGGPRRFGIRRSIRDQAAAVACASVETEAMVFRICDAIW